MVQHWTEYDLNSVKGNSVKDNTYYLRKFTLHGPQYPHIVLHSCLTNVKGYDDVQSSSYDVIRTYLNVYKYKTFLLKHIKLTLFYIRNTCMIIFIEWDDDGIPLVQKPEPAEDLKLLLGLG